MQRPTGLLPRGIDVAISQPQVCSTISRDPWNHKHNCTTIFPRFTIYEERDSSPMAETSQSTNSCYRPTCTPSPISYFTRHLTFGRYWKSRKLWNTSIHKARFMAIFVGYESSMIQYITMLTLRSRRMSSWMIIFMSKWPTLVWLDSQKLQTRDLERYIWTLQPQNYSESPRMTTIRPTTHLPEHKGRTSTRLDAFFMKCVITNAPIVLQCWLA